MRASEYLLSTLKDVPQDAECLSHKLMYRSGLIRKLASGTYTYLPLGLKVLRKIEGIIREEMNNAGALEILMPALHPAELWKESGRWEILGDDMLHFEDRHGRLNVLGPTHEEIVTDLARKEIHSYKQLPLTLYQIQTKFRDELRPRSGVIRSREFIMKDSYSFHLTDDSLNQTYEKIKDAYVRIFQRCGIKVFIVKADPGAMGGGDSQEFLCFSDSGEDKVAQIGNSDEVLSVEMGLRKLKGLSLASNDSKSVYKKVHTPGSSSIESVSKFMKKKTSSIVKAMIYDTNEKDVSLEKRLVMVLLRGDHEASDYKVKRILKSNNAALATRDNIEKAGSAFGFSGPLGFKGHSILIDEDVLDIKNFVIGANEDGYHYDNVEITDIANYDRNKELIIGDFRHLIDGDLSQESGVKYNVRTAIELGHIFKLNKRYSEPLKAQVVDENHATQTILMGCYGIGVNRLIAAAIEQSSRLDSGISWPSSEISPFEILIMCLNSNDAGTIEVTERIYKESLAHGWDVIIDDRNLSAGIKFKDADLIGIPIQVVIGPKGLKEGKIEVRNKQSGETLSIKVDDAINEIKKYIKRQI